ncbi:RpiB/LacA/LacB family sugar-phosphate isomerase [Aeromicrobium sp. CF4.19]|uniref:RpiB/LacA/LacB family sugar-phosphate isomerase n=1 Tax=Aeromicrobium sp. CF4.19 TaxID=3373082 RepID=UPI003EE7E802
MRIALSNDHAGHPLKETVVRLLGDLGHEVLDSGTTDDSPVDFPDMTARVCADILDGRADRGVLVCGTGVGASIAANKTPGIRAAVAAEAFSAGQGVEHDDVNVLCLGAWLVGPVFVEPILRAFLEAEFSTDPDFRRRVDKLHALDRAGRH